MWGISWSDPEAGTGLRGEHPADYLNRLNERYEAWISTYTKGKVLVINVDNMDFEHNPEQLGDIITKVDAELHGLF